jgi:uncharacterized membrane protein
MVDAKLIEKWVHEGTITQAQAEKMLVDSTERQKDTSSNNFVITISTIGAILLGVGVILFVASNWQMMPDMVKTILLIGSTFLFYFLGYDFKYHRRDLPKVGAALLFLGGILFGATLFLLAQIYHVEANSHIIALIWLIGILPFVYAFTSVEMAGLAALVFYIWVTLFVLQDMLGGAFGWFGGSSNYNNLFYLPVVYLLSGIALFGIGGLHYFKSSLSKIARLFRLFGLRVGMVALFLLSFRFFSGNYEGYSFRGEAVPNEELTIILTLLAVLGIGTLFVNILYNPSKSKAPGVEFYINLALVVLTLIFFNFPLYDNSYVILFNLVLAGIIFLLFQQGYYRQDMAIVNTGLFFFVVFIIAKYFDFFWGLLDRSAFFIVGGVILLALGTIVERKRREIKARFLHNV